MALLIHPEIPLTWRQLVVRTAKDTISDDAMGLAAQLAYYFLLALFPLLICLIALASLLPLENFIDEITGMLAPVAPSEMVALVRDQMLQLASGDDGGLVGIGLLGALWSSSAAMVAIVGAMNRAYDIDEGRPWWRVRLTAIVLTVGLAIFIVLSALLVIVGPEVGEHVAGWLGLGPAFVWTWTVLRWPIAFGLVSLGIALVYYYAPDAEQDWAWVTPGSLLASVLWLVGSLGFRFYVVNFGNFDKTYGTIGAVIVLMLWLYLSGFVIVIGAEMNAELEHASPWGKDPGEKVPGEKKRIGSLAARDYCEKNGSPAG